MDAILTDAILRKAIVARLKQAPRTRAPRELLRIVPHGIVIAGCFWFLAHRASDLAALALLASCVLGHSYGCLALLAHDVSHGSVVQSRTGRYWIETLLWAPLFMPPSLWRVLHNRTHHTHANTPKDSDRAYLALDGHLGMKSLYMKLFSPLRGSLGIANPLFLLHFATYVFRNVCSVGLGVPLPIVAGQPRVSSRERLRILAELVVLLAVHASVLTVMGLNLATLVLLEGIPMVVASGVLMAFIFTNHLSMPVFNSPNVLETTVSLKLPAPLSVLYSRFDHHIEHHLFPRYPSSAYPEVARILRELVGEDYSVPFVTAWRAVLRSPYIRPPDEPKPLWPRKDPC